MMTAPTCSNLYISGIYLPPTPPRGKKYAGGVIFLRSSSRQTVNKSNRSESERVKANSPYQGYRGVTGVYQDSTTTNHASQKKTTHFSGVNHPGRNAPFCDKGHTKRTETQTLSNAKVVVRFEGRALLLYNAVYNIYKIKN